MEDFSKYLLKDLERDVRNAKIRDKYKNKNIIERIEEMENLISDLSHILKILKDEINE